MPKALIALGMPMKGRMMDKGSPKGPSSAMDEAEGDDYSTDEEDVGQEETDAAQIMMDATDAETYARGFKNFLKACGVI